MTRKWIPTAWVDEVVPKLGESPSAFLKRNAAGVLQLVPLDKEEAGEPDARISDLQPNQRVDFCWTEDRGTGTLVVNADGTWGCSVVFPPDTTHFWLPGDTDSLSNDFLELVKGDEFRPALAPGEYEVEGYTWSAAITFTVRVLESGAADFIPVGPGRLTRDADFPVEAAEIVAAFNTVAGGYMTKDVLEAAANFLIAAIGVHGKATGRTREQAMKVAETFGKSLPERVSEQWDRKPEATDVKVALDGN